MPKITVPGLIYSLISAIAAWAILYFDVGGAGADYVIAPIILGGIPVLLKMFTVQVPPTVEPSAAVSRGEAVEQPSKMQRFLFG
jgi:hypothetical protein